MKIEVILLLFSFGFGIEGCVRRSTDSDKFSRIKVHYLLWCGPLPANAPRRHTIQFVPVNSTFTDVMNQATISSNGFKYEFIQYSFGKYITSIGGFKENLQEKIYWMTYKVPGEPSTQSPPGNEFLSPVGVDSIIVRNGDNYLFWLKHVE